MTIYSDREERFLSYIGHQPGDVEKTTWKDILYTGLEGYAHWFVKLEHVFQRGVDVEALTMVLTGDAEKAWEAAEPYYKYASGRGHALAAYRCAKWVESFHGTSEFIYPHYLERAVELGHPQAIRDYVKYYDEFKAKTITKDAWKRQERQERLFFKCCKKLADEGDAQALWELGTCYLFGTGVKEDKAKGVVMRDRALEELNLDEEDLERQIAVQAYFREEALEENEPFVKMLFRMICNLMKTAKKKERQ